MTSTGGAGEPCEICGAALQDWELAPGQVLGRCSSCGHIRRDLDRCPAAHRTPAWGGEAELDRVRLALTYHRVRSLLRDVQLRDRAPRVFEAGFGSGALLRRFLDDGAEVGGADPGGLERDVDPVLAASGALVAGPLDDATPGAGTYDLVLAVHVVEHVPDPWAFVAACRRLLHPRGRIVLVTPAADSRGLARWGSSWWMLEDPTHVRFFSALSLALLLARSGLSEVRVGRPLADSLSVDAASLVRHRAAVRGEAGEPAGVLPQRSTRLLAAASVPAVLAVRAALSSARPSLQAVAVRP